MRRIVSLIGLEHKIDGYALFAEWVASICGKSSTFVISCLSIVVWLATGPIFDYSVSWQLVVNTGTTIVTFLMMFLLQNTQNRDTEAIQKKLDALLIEIATNNAKKE